MSMYITVAVQRLINVEHEWTVALLPLLVSKPLVMIDVIYSAD